MAKLANWLRLAVLAGAAALMAAPSIEAVAGVASVLGDAVGL